jgi:hypothetical protein
VGGAFLILSNDGEASLFWKRRKTFSYTCSCCGEKMEGSPSFGGGSSPFICDIPEGEVESRVYSDYNLCHVRQVAGEVSDDDVFGIRTMLYIPIRGVKDPFSWSVWVTQSRQNFLDFVDASGSDEGGRITFGWMPVTISSYVRTARDKPLESLACNVHWQAGGLRPFITLHECDHPLYRDQSKGISWDRAIEIAQQQIQLAHRPN